MPTQPPHYRPAGWTERKAWAQPVGFKDVRKRGRAGQQDRKEVMDAEPFCRLCLSAGLRVASDVVDHIMPLAWGGSDERWNKQALCHPCHDAKSAGERKFGRNGR